ncbi:hypothetical protein MRB53_037653 [Persea americana]|nr:hypothetical protein MRB53_037653 [Persea americana]
MLRIPKGIPSISPHRSCRTRQGEATAIQMSRATLPRGRWTCKHNRVMAPAAIKDLEMSTTDPTNPPAPLADETDDPMADPDLLDDEDDDDEELFDAAQSLLHHLLTTCPISTTPTHLTSASGVTMALPAPVYQLPREKKVPAKKAKTKWEAFAEKKGHRARGPDGARRGPAGGRGRRGKVWDAEKGEWVRKYGYKGRGMQKDGEWLVEVDEKAERKAAEGGDASGRGGKGKGRRGGANGNGEAVLDPRKMARAERGWRSLIAWYEAVAKRKLREKKRRPLDQVKYRKLLAESNRSIYWPREITSGILSVQRLCERVRARVGRVFDGEFEFDRGSADVKDAAKIRALVAERLAQGS